MVEGQENPLPIIATAKLFEVQKFCSLTSHVWDAYLILGNRRAFKALPQKLQDIVQAEFDRAGKDERADTEALSQNLRADLTAKGMTFVEPDRAAFRDTLRKAGFYKTWQGKFGDPGWKLLQDVAGDLT